MKKFFLLTLLLSTNVYANTDIANNFTYIGFGYKATNYSSDAMTPYFGDKYNNSESKGLAGLYLDASANITDDVFVEGNADFQTRFSSEINTWSAGLGYVIKRSSTFSVPVSCGVVNYSADRDVRHYSETSGYCKAGIKAQLAKHWMTDLSYRYEAVEEHKNVVGLKNVFQLGSTFGLVAGLEYANRIESEFSYNLGVQFSFI
ncbi:outer membrane beta-barrel protein [Moritella sp. F3]|uniref:outer membrane beta-barrel protein n=1 Tax=Moritella sp. F3 TaxID=2718882 RepID=UPI0018E0E803|nr:outer membrane beta-barrel protein [Moritella sp. F3]GIC78865.1 hypothetical protein FMO001_35920 [Moritella sp. F1]GIC81900.1 hypothetical protein FMO003_21810 [Moritella sp. F3]